MTKPAQEEYGLVNSFDMTLIVLTRLLNSNQPNIWAQLFKANDVVS